MSHLLRCPIRGCNWKTEIPENPTDSLKTCNKINEEFIKHLETAHTLNQIMTALLSHAISFSVKTEEQGAP